MQDKKTYYTEAQRLATVKYMSENLEQVRFRVKKGELEILKECAKRHGLSMAQYIIKAVNTFEGWQVLSPSEKEKPT